MTWNLNQLLVRCRKCTLLHSFYEKNIHFFFFLCYLTLVSGVPKEKVCDDTMIELDVEAKGQWPLCRAPNSLELVPPLPLSNPLLSVTFAPKNNQELDTAEDRWLSQVEIVTHAGPHRRLWMGPQFVFKTYNAPSGLVFSQFSFVSRDFSNLTKVNFYQRCC